MTPPATAQLVREPGLGARVGAAARVTRGGWLSERRLVPALLLISGVVLLILGRNQWFWYDEWNFFVERGRDSFADLFRPHNEHLTALPLLAYRVLFALFGLTSYLPYYAFFLSVHLTAVYLLFRILRVSAVPLAPAVAGALLVAFLGAGAENVLWAWQIGLVGSLAFFLGAVLLVLTRPDAEGDVPIVLLLLGSLLCSGVGVAAVAGVALARGWQRRSVAGFMRIATAPAVAYLFWFGVLGRGGAHEGSGSLLASAALAPQFVFTLVAAAAAGLVGLPTTAIGPSLVVLLAVIVAGYYVRLGCLPTATVAGLGMLGALAVTTALLRASQFGLEQASSGRYVHLGAALLVLAGLPMLYGATAAAHVARTAVAGALALVVMLVANLILLIGAARYQADLEQAVHRRLDATAALLTQGDVPFLPHAKLQPQLAPALTVAGVDRLLRDGRLGDVGADRLDPVEFAAAMTAMQTSVSPIGAEQANRLPVMKVAQQDLEMVPGSPGCLEARGLPGAPQLLLSYDRAGALQLIGSSQDTVRIYQGQAVEFGVSSYREVALTPGGFFSFEVAEPVGDTAYLRIDVPVGGTVQLCAG